jgi:hypothetical protein
VQANRAYEPTSRTIDVTGNANLPSYTDTIQILADGNTYTISVCICMFSVCIHFRLESYVLKSFLVK